MTTPDESAHRRRTRATGEDMAVRDAEEIDDDEDVFEVRMPIASLGEVRNEGDEPLTRDEIDGMARQLNDREIGVFPGHGGDDLVAGGRYSQFEKLGVWQDATVEEREGADVLVATARMPDPETLPAATGEYRQALGILKEQATRGIPMDASIGWRDDEEYPGGVDLMEASIVGIGADPRTNTGDESASVVARAAVDAGADPEALVAEVRDAVTTDDAHMTENESGDDAGTTDDEQAAEDTESERVSEGEYRQRMLDLQTQQMEVLSSLAERESDDEDDEEDDDKEDEDDEEEDDDESEQSADAPDEEQDADGDDDATEERDANPDDESGEDDARDVADEVAALREELDALREKGLSADDVDTPDAERDEDADDEQTRETETPDPTDGLGDYR